MDAGSHCDFEEKTFIICGFSIKSDILNIQYCQSVETIQNSNFGMLCHLGTLTVTDCCPQQSPQFEADQKVHNRCAVDDGSRVMDNDFQLRVRQAA